MIVHTKAPTLPRNLIALYNRTYLDMPPRGIVTPLTHAATSLHGITQDRTNPSYFLETKQAIASSCEKCISMIDTWLAESSIASSPFLFDLFSLYVFILWLTVLFRERFSGRILPALVVLGCVLASIDFFQHYHRRRTATM
jgi:hypothetical protein